MKTTEVPLTIETTTDAIHVVPASEQCESPRGQSREYRSLAISTALHMGILLMMTFCVFPATISSHVDLTALFNSGEGDALYEFPLLDDAAPQLPVEFEIAAPILETNSELLEIDISSIRPHVPATIEAQSSAPSTLSPGPSAESSLAASSIEEAVDRVTGSLHGKLREGDLLVVWLLDASHSVADDRQRLATQLESFLPRLAGPADSRHQLLNAVVSFGAAMEERVAPTESRDPILNAVRELPIDASGKENVFAAIEQCVATYRRKWNDKQLTIVVWTDESGDDATKLENTIRICRENGVSVSVVGPSAVLGADTGIYSYSDPQTHQIQQLPVKLGPDSALPERLELGYWFLTQEPQAEFGLRPGFGTADLPSWYGDDDRNVPGHRCVAATEVALPSWYGDRDLKGLVSGFSPYALTRLTSRTGGTYVILDRNDEGGPFSADAMRAYLPDYRSIEEYLHDVNSHPLRRAVMEAVKVTQDKNLSPPPTILFGKQSESPPYGFMRTYFTPSRFAGYCRTSRRRLKVRADRTTRIVRQALAHVSEPGSVERGLEYEYERETSRRWRAWYDLTRGRLLATSVRLEEYRLACDLTVKPGFLNPTTNHLIFVPAMEMKSRSVFHRRAEEAERLLVRCVHENPNTPWAWLAQRELDYGLGINVRQHTLTPVVMPPSMTRQPHFPRL